MLLHSCGGRHVVGACFLCQGVNLLVHFNVGCIKHSFVKVFLELLFCFVSALSSSSNSCWCGGWGLREVGLVVKVGGNPGAMNVSVGVLNDVIDRLLPNISFSDVASVYLVERGRVGVDAGDVS